MRFHAVAIVGLSQLWSCIWKVEHQCIATFSIEETAVKTALEEELE